MLGLGMPLSGSARRGVTGPPVNPVQTNIFGWHKYGVGITQAGGFASQWDDASGNGNHAKQPTATNQPAVNGSALLFDGVDNFMKWDAVTRNIPRTVYLLIKQVGWTAGKYIMDGNTVNTGFIYQSTTSPNIRLGGDPAFIDLAIGTYGVVTAVFNGASSLIQVNNGTPVTGTAGASMGGLYLGAAGGGFGLYTNIELKEVIDYAVAHDATDRGLVNAYLASVMSLP